MKTEYKTFNFQHYSTILNSKSLLFTVFFCLLFGGSISAQTLAEAQALKKQGLAAMNQHEYPVALEYLTNAQVLAEKNNWYEEVFETKNNIGIVYMNLSDYGEALNYFLDAYTIAIKHLDSNNEMSVLNNIAVIYCMDKNFKKGREYYLKAYELAKKTNNKAKMGVYAMNLVKVAHLFNELDTARNYLEEVKAFSEEDPALHFELQAMTADNYMLRGDLKTAKKILLDLEAQPKVKGFRTKDNTSTLLNLLSRVYYLEKNYDRSIYYLNASLKVAEDLETKADVYSSLSDSYAMKKDYGKALEATKMMISATDSIAKRKNEKLYENNKVKFEVMNYKSDLKASVAASKLERKIFGIALFLLVVFIFFGYRSFRNRSIKQEQKKIIAEGQQKIIALELEKEKSDNLLLEKHIKEIANEALLEQERLKGEIEQRNRKLSAKALYLSGRNAMIEEMVQSLSNLDSVSQNHLIKNHIKALKEHLKSDSEWDEFIVHFEEVNQGLLTALKDKHPQLNANDIRFICYVYMNLSFKEIGAILNITQEACRKRKERISGKMDIDKNTSFYEYLSSIGRPSNT
ncbi:tetratricopeptide repeat protein [Flavobacterium sp. SM2513]|uniref:tetratricopeptide repeat protein n=1 Tax=Flavobacterium sp. SM2513 TaxID=3424766 RepID=UPI003D7FD0A5